MKRNQILIIFFVAVLVVGIVQSAFGTTYVVTTRYELKSGYPWNAVTAVETDIATEYGPVWGLGFKVPPPVLTYTADYSGNLLGVLLAMVGAIGVMLSRKRMGNPLRLVVITLLVAVCIISVASIPYLGIPGTVTQASSTVSQVHVHVISEWQALRVAFGSSRNFTTLPPPYFPQTSSNVTATLELVAFYAWLPSGPYNLTSGGYNVTIIPVDNQTGLPTKPLVIYPNGPFEPYGECLQAMYVWGIEVYPAPYPYGGDIYLDAVNGQRIGDLRGISFGLTCATTSTTPASTQTQTPTSVALNSFPSRLGKTLKVEKVTKR